MPCLHTWLQMARALQHSEVLRSAGAALRTRAETDTSLHGPARRFTIRHITQVFQGLLQSTPEKYNAGAGQLPRSLLRAPLLPCLPDGPALAWLVCICQCRAYASATCARPPSLQTPPSSSVCGCTRASAPVSGWRAAGGCRGSWCYCILPAVAARPLQSYDHCRCCVLVPWTHPPTPFHPHLQTPTAWCLLPTCSSTARSR